MALDELRRNIELEAEEAASKLEEEGESEYKKIIAEAKRKADTALKKAKADALSESEQKKNDIATSLDIETGGILSFAKEECINREMKQLVLAVKSKLDERQTEIINTALERFSESVPLHQTIAKLDKRHAGAVKAPVAKVEYEDMDGVILTSIDGKVMADATLEGIVGSNSDLIRRALAMELFG